jgi:hypothetical protein
MTDGKLCPMCKSRLPLDAASCSCGFGFVVASGHGPRWNAYVGFAVAVVVVSVGYYVVTRNSSSAPSSVGSDNCADREWEMVTPNGTRERVPQAYVTSAVTDKGYTFPPEAQRVMLAGQNTTHTCHEDVTLPFDEVEGALRRDGFKFRGYRAASAEEWKADENRRKFGEPK